MAKKVTPRKSTRPKTRKTFRVGLIGAGGIARTHADHYKQIPGVEVIAAADIVAKNLEIMKDKFGVAELYADWKDMLAQSQLDAVSICTPTTCTTTDPRCPERRPARDDRKALGHERHRRSGHEGPCPQEGPGVHDRFPASLRGGDADDQARGR
jgi:hypothetical protein